MARRIVRTAIQLTALSILLLALLFFLDLRYRLLPTSIHNRLPQHHAGTVITDITYHPCSKIQLLSGCMLDPKQGWYRIDKDVYLGDTYLSQGYIHAKRRKEEEYNAASGEKVVVDVKVGRLQPPAEGDVKWESRPGGIWIKRQNKVVDNAVTAVDLLFGADAVEVRRGWTLLEGALTVGREVKITVRKGPPERSEVPVLRFRKDHKFKIIQVADLHLSTGTGKCRDAEPPETAAKCEADPRTLDFLGKILDEEKPDLAVLTGDQVNGETAPDAQTAIFKFAELFIKRKIPYATILGNHDDEGNLSREQIMKLTEGLPYSLSEVGPELGPIIKNRKGLEVREGGVGNYLIEILAHKNDHSALTLYFFDTHSYSPDDKKYHGYDWIKQCQIDWFKETYAGLQEAHGNYAFMHLDMAFIHIPLPEYRNAKSPVIGSWKEPPTAPHFNSGFQKILSNAGVKVVSAGHDHANDYCMLEKDGDKLNMWMCYAGGSGFGGYGGYGGYHRRLRLFEIDAPADKISTWKRLEWGEEGKVDFQVVVEEGKVVAS